MNTTMTEIMQGIDTGSSDRDCLEHFLQHQTKIVHYVGSRLKLPRDQAASFHRNYDAAMAHYGPLLNPEEAKDLCLNLTAAGFYLGLLRAHYISPDVANSAYMFIAGSILPLYNVPTVKDENRQKMQ
jgi:hypothetical protein